jgi:hypothetical protein
MALMNSVETYRYFYYKRSMYLLTVHLVEVQLNSMKVLFLTFCGISMLISIVAGLIYIHTSTEFLLFGSQNSY